MPQLALETFFNQYIWLLVVLFGFYFFTIIVVIPSISLINKTRDKWSKIDVELVTQKKTNTNVISSLYLLDSKK